MSSKFGLGFSRYVLSTSLCRFGPISQGKVPKNTYTVHTRTDPHLLAEVPGTVTFTTTDSRLAIASLHSLVLHALCYLE